MGQTPLGIPYPEGGDSPAGHTQMRALAEAVDGLAGIAMGNLTPAPGWVDYTGSFGGMFITRHGGLIVIDAMLAPVADTPIAVGIDYPMAVLPGGFYPARDVLGPVAFKFSGNFPTFGQFKIDRWSGDIKFASSVAGTMMGFGRGGWVSLNLAYRFGEPAPTPPAQL